MRPIDAIERWPGTHAAAVVVRDDGGPRVTRNAGPMDQRFSHASVTKLASSLAVLVEIEAGSCRLDDPCGPPGATLAHLLSHASGLPLDGDEPVAPPGQRRIYSNRGIERAVEHAAIAAAMTPVALVASRVLEPLGMAETVLLGSVASGAVGSTADLCLLAAELLAPTLLDDLAAAQRTVTFPGLAGVLPGFGRHDPCDWGLGAEVKGSKRPHWTGARWPSSTVGHFGQAGGFLAVDYDDGIAVVTLGDEPFGPWATAAWPVFTDEVHAAR